jgi:hypothetical protein
MLHFQESVAAITQRITVNRFLEVFIQQKMPSLRLDVNEIKD